MIIFAAIETDRQAGKIFINSIRSIHYKDSDLSIIKWINGGLADYIKPSFEKEWFEPIKNKFLSKQQSNSADVRKELNSVAKILQNFENPKLLDEKNNDDTEFSIESDIPSENTTNVFARGCRNLVAWGKDSLYTRERCSGFAVFCSFWITNQPTCSI